MGCVCDVVRVGCSGGIKNETCDDGDRLLLACRLMLWQECKLHSRSQETVVNPNSNWALLVEMSESSQMADAD